MQKRARFVLYFAANPHRTFRKGVRRQVPRRLEARVRLARPQHQTLGPPREGLYVRMTSSFASTSASFCSDKIPTRVQYTSTSCANEDASVVSLLRATFVQKRYEYQNEYVNMSTIEYSPIASPTRIMLVTNQLVL